MKGKCCPLSMLCWLLLVVGGLNWGLVGLAGLFGGEGANWNLVKLLFGSWPTVEGIVYLLVGLAAVFGLIKKLTCKGGCHCKDGEKCEGGVCKKPE